MEKRELSIFKELYEKLKEENEDQIYIRSKEIERLQKDIEKRKNIDLVKQIYEEFRLYENNISLNNFRIGLYTLSNLKAI